MRTALPLLCVLSAAALAQQDASLPSFEAASVKPNPRAKAGGEGSRKSSFSVDPGRLNMNNVTLHTAIRVAFDVKDYQVEGPSSIDEERFDIVATSGSAVAPEEIHHMLQRLLAERFKLEYHKVKKELPAYILTVAKSGPKFHESKSAGEFSAKPTGRTSAEFQHVTPAFMVDTLSQILRAPVIDQTGLTGQYDAAVDLTSYLPEGFEHGPGGPPDLVGLVMAALPEQLGLKLESRKAPLDLIVVDHIEKAPSEN